jgi:sugar-specific transcriptional regulator TrmB
MIIKEKLTSELEEIFQSLNMDDKSAKFYLDCLINGKTTINQISKNINVARSTCYLILERLKSLGLVIETPYGKKRSLIAQNPSNLVNLIKENKEKTEKAYNLVQEVLPQLNPYSKLSTGTKVRFYDGFESIKQLYYESFEAKLIYVICLTQIENVDFWKFMDGYINKLHEKGIKSLELVTDTPSDLEYKKKYSTEISEIRCIPKEYIADTDYMVWDNKVAFISYKNQRYTGVLIEDQEIARFEKNRFKLLWNSFTDKN